MLQFTVPGRLPGYNELGAGHWARRGRIKREAMEAVGWIIKANGIQPITSKVQVEIRCYEQNRRRDDDNVTSGASKIILDALQNIGILKGDGQKYVRCVKHPVEVDCENPRIEITITPL